MPLSVCIGSNSRLTMSQKLHSFAVIEGGAPTLSPWLDLPRRLIARSPFDQSVAIDLRFSRERLQKLDRVSIRQPVLDAWSMVHGRVPRLPNSSKIVEQLAGRTLLGLRDAHACFRGTMRPVGDDDHGFDMAIYVSKPSVFIRYEPSLVCVGRVDRVADDLVFATYVKLDRPGAPTKRGCLRSVSGVVTHWQFVEADSHDQLLPTGYEERYRRRLW